MEYKIIMRSGHIHDVKIPIKNIQLSANDIVGRIKIGNKESWYMFESAMIPDKKILICLNRIESIEDI